MQPGKTITGGRNWRPVATLAAAVWLAICLSVGAPGPGAQAQEFGLPDSSILLVDPNRLFVETKFGKRVQADLKERFDALSRENRRIEAELEAEELALTQERTDLDPEVFRTKADAFHEKVQGIRAERVAKANAWQADADSAERRFLTVAGPILEQMMQESGAAVLLDLRAVLWRSDAVDVTDEAVRRFDLAIGDGANVEIPRPPAPNPPTLDMTGQGDAPTEEQPQE